MGELPREAFEAMELSPEASQSGEVTHRYLLSSVLASCMRASRDAKGVKVRFNRDGVMSNQFIYRGRGNADLWCEAVVSPLAIEVSPFGAGAPATMSAPSAAPGFMAAGRQGP